MEELQNLLIRLAHAANAAQAHYQTWFALRGEGKALPEYYSEINDFRYVDFFHASNIGHYKLMFIELGCLFDPDPRAASFRNLKRCLAEQEFNDLVDRINDSLAPFSQLVSNALTIRSKLIAHREISASSESVHEENGVIPDQISNLLNICSELINEVNGRVFGDSELLIATTTNRFEFATMGLLKTLRNGRS